MTGVQTCALPILITVEASCAGTLLKIALEPGNTVPVLTPVAVVGEPGEDADARSPLCGRNFEYFSEDPYLAGKMAASYVRGIQSRGVHACPKHFAVNSQELRRMAMNAVVDERTLREIYLTGFEIAVKEGGARSIMNLPFPIPTSI